MSTVATRFGDFTVTATYGLGNAGESSLSWKGRTVFKESQLTREARMTLFPYLEEAAKLAAAQLKPYDRFREVNGLLQDSLRSTVRKLIPVGLRGGNFTAHNGDRQEALGLFGSHELLIEAAEALLKEDGLTCGELIVIHHESGKLTQEAVGDCDHSLVEPAWLSNGVTRSA